MNVIDYNPLIKEQSMSPHPYQQMDEWLDEQINKYINGKFDKE